MTEPLVRAEVDLRDFEFMPLDVVRLRDSDLAARTTGEEFRAAVLLWCASWHQVPAASLPDDDIVLSALAGFGRVIKEWKAVRSGALHGWEKCSDGRLYHSVVAEKANEAWLQKRIYVWRKDCDRVRKENISRQKAGLIPLELPPNPSENGKIPAEKADFSGGKHKLSDGIPAENALNRTEHTGTKRENSPLSCLTTLPSEGGGEDFEKLFEGYIAALPEESRHSRARARIEFEALSLEDRALAAAVAPVYTEGFRRKPTTHPVAADKFLRDRRFEGLRPPSDRGGSKVFVPEGSAGWKGWAVSGHPESLVTTYQGKPGWWFASQFPTESPVS